MSRRFKRPPVMDTATVINGYSNVIEWGYGMLNSIPEECSVDRSLVGSMISKYKRAREGLADLLDVKVGPALTGAPEITRASRIDWASDTVEPDGQRIANHHISASVSDELSSNISIKEIPTMSKVMPAGIQLNNVTMSAHAPVAKNVRRPLICTINIDTDKSITATASGYGWVAPDICFRATFKVGKFGVELFHYDWVAGDNSITLTAEVLEKLIGNSSVLDMLVDSNGMTVTEVEKATWRVSVVNRSK
jgi:hypothetical protein